MKLVTNKPYDSIFTFFPELSSAGEYTIQSPAIWRNVCDNNNIVTLRFNLATAYKYILLKVFASAEYVLSCSNSQLEFNLYDYANFEVNEKLEVLSEPILSGIVGYNQSSWFKYEFPKVLLLEIKPHSYNYVGSAIVRLSEKTDEINLQAHWERDWFNRVDGSCWDVSGKVRTLYSLSQAERRHLPSFSILPVMCSGAKCELFEYNNEQLNTLEDFQVHSQNATKLSEYLSQTIECVDNAIAKYTFELYAESEQNAQFYFSDNIMLAVEGEQVQKSYYDTSVALSKGFTKFEAYCEPQSYSYFEMSHQFYSPNKFNIDKRVNWQQLQQSIIRSESAISLEASQTRSVPVSFPSQFCCLSFFLKSTTSSSQYDVVKFSSITIKHIYNNTYAIVLPSGKAEQFELQDNSEYVFFGINISKNCISISAGETYAQYFLEGIQAFPDSILFGGNGNVLLKKFKCFSKCLTQVELNEVRRMPA